MSDQNETRWGWLKGYSIHNETITSLEINKRRIELELKRSQDGSYTRMRDLVRLSGSKPSEALATVNQELDTLSRRRADLLNVINLFTEPTRSLLRYKYIDGMTMTEIADRLHFSLSQTKRIHAAAHETLDFLDRFDKTRYQVN